MRSRSRKSGSKPVALKTRAFGSASAARSACSLDASTMRTLIPCASSTRAIAAPTRPAPKMTTSRTAPPSGQRSALHSFAGPRRADDDDPVAGADLVVAAGEHRLVAADDRGDLRVRGDRRVAERDADDLGRRVLLDVELADLHLAVREDVRLSRGRDADDAADRVRRLELGPDDEVDVELALAPEVDVLGARGADHRRRAFAPRAARTSRRRG